MWARSEQVTGRSGGHGQVTVRWRSGHRAVRWAGRGDRRMVRNTTYIGTYIQHVSKTINNVTITVT